MKSWTMASLSVIWLSFLLVLTSNAEAQTKNCHIGGRIDNIVVASMSGCDWAASSKLRLGLTGYVIHPHVAKFTPNAEVDATATGLFGRWVLGVNAGMGGYWATDRIAGFSSAFVFFTGTMAVAPHAGVFALFQPTALGVPNDDNIVMRPHLGIKAKLSENSALFSGAQLFFPRLSHEPDIFKPGAYAVLLYAF